MRPASKALSCRCSAVISRSNCLIANRSVSLATRASWQLLRDSQGITRSPRPARIPKENLPNAHALSYDGFATLSKTCIVGFTSHDEFDGSRNAGHNFDVVSDAISQLLWSRRLPNALWSWSGTLQGALEPICFASPALSSDPLYASSLTPDALLQMQFANGVWPAFSGDAESSGLYEAPKPSTRCSRRAAKNRRVMEMEIQMGRAGRAGRSGKVWVALDAGRCQLGDPHRVEHRPRHPRFHVRILEP